MMNLDLYLKGFGFVKAEYVGVVETTNWEPVGTIIEPVDKGYLDVIDDPLTVFASSNGLCVDDLMTISYQEYIELGGE